MSDQTNLPRSPDATACVRRCARCKAIKPVDVFRRLTNPAKGEYYSYCRPCATAKRLESARKAGRPARETDLAQRFWRRVDKRNADGCWLWCGVRAAKGYGQISRNNKHAAAHRISWELANGAVPDGLWVLHKCDNPPCVRPDHLFLGTRADNTSDMFAKGRDALRPWVMRRGGYDGESNPRAKLSDEQVAEMRRRFVAGGVTATALGREFGCSGTHARQIISGKKRGGINRSASHDDGASVLAELRARGWHVDTERRTVADAVEPRHVYAIDNDTALRMALARARGDHAAYLYLALPTDAECDREHARQAAAAAECAGDESEWR